DLAPRWDRYICAPVTPHIVDKNRACQTMRRQVPFFAPLNEVPMPETKLATKPAAARGAEQSVAPLIARARAAMAVYAKQISAHGQARIDEAVTALAWSIYKPENARRLAELAVEVTGIGEVESKVVKNQRKTFGTLRDLLRVKSTGIIEEIPE